MLNSDLGKYITAMRQELNLSQQTLCDGLCTPAAISKMEKGTANMDILLTDKILERLGRSSGGFSLLISDDEYDALLEYKTIEKLVNGGNFELAEKRLEAFINRHEIQENFKNQYLFRTGAAIAAGRGDHDEAAELYKKSVECTLPGFCKSRERRRKALMCVEELALLTALANEYYKLGRTKDAEELLELVLSYTEKYYIRTLEIAKVYPKAAYLRAIHGGCGGSLGLGDVGGVDEKDVKSLRRCEKAFEYLIEDGSVYFLGEITEALISYYEKLNLSEKSKKLRLQIDALKSIFDEEGVEFYSSRLNMAFFMVCDRRSYFICSEMVRGQRLGLGLSQEEVADGVYKSVESISRIETGKQVPTARKQAMLLEKLHMPMGRYNLKFQADCYGSVCKDVFGKDIKLEKALSSFEFEEAKLLIEEIRAKIDGENPLNKQYLDSKEAFVDYRLKIIDAQTYYDRILEALRLTYPEIDGTLCRIPSANEIAAFNSLAISLWEQGERDESVAFFRKLVDCYINSRLRMEHCHNGLGSILKNYMKAAEENDRPEEAEWACRTSVLQDLAVGRCDHMNIYLSTRIAFAEKSEVGEAERKELLRKHISRAFYVAELYGNAKAAGVWDKLYRDKVDGSVVWY